MSAKAAKNKAGAAALIEELAEHYPAREGEESARPFTFGTEGMRPTGALPALDRLSERMARRLRDTIEPFARMKPSIDASPVKFCRFESWRSEQPEFTALSLYRLKPLKGGMLMSIEPALISALVDTFYGGCGIHGERIIREFTASEEQLLTRLSEAIIQTLTEVWAEVMTIKPQLSARETNTAYASLIAGDEPVAVARFRVRLGQDESRLIDIVYPVSSIRAVEDELAANLHDEVSGSAAEWRARLGSALGEVRLQARSVLARPELSVSELMKLAPGDVIPISVPSLVPLLVAGRRIALGKIGDHDGRAALKIEKMEHRRSI
jgi:flagellar motor switch protein FliM